ncbi:MAG: hypothetical protein Q4D98_10520 [Planctomycetia bacterium]|nr:hypothetical protein [Planctomycetia bacterium]
MKKECFWAVLLVTTCVLAEDGGLTRKDVKEIPSDALFAVAVQASPQTAYRMTKEKIKAVLPLDSQISAWKRQAQTRWNLPSLSEKLPSAGTTVCFWTMNHPSTEYFALTMTVPKPEQVRAFFEKNLKESWQVQLSETPLGNLGHAYQLYPEVFGNNPFFRPYGALEGNRLVLTSSKGQMKAVVRRLQGDGADSLWDNPTVAAFLNGKSPCWVVYCDTPSFVKTFYPLFKAAVKSGVLAFQETLPFLNDGYEWLPKTETLSRSVNPFVIGF